MKKPIDGLTELQLDVIRVLWERGEASAAEVAGALAPRRKLAQTTVATLLTRLEKKGVVAHSVEGRTYLYRACVKETEARSSIVARVKKAFAGDVSTLFAQLLRDDEIGAEELAQVRELIAQRERELKRNHGK
jgi:BlaI family transcriptional regulator, penicillinase repressor